MVCWLKCFVRLSGDVIYKLIGCLAWAARICVHCAPGGDRLAHQQGSELCWVRVICVVVLRLVVDRRRALD
jgi:hypothetical protein